MKLLCEKKFDIVKGEYGPRMSLYAPWSSNIEKAMKKRGVVELELNRAKGWRGTDVSFLSRVSHLLAIVIIDWKDYDISAVHNLHELRFLEIMRYCDSEIDFACFPKLEEVSLEWRAKAKTLFDCTTLKRVFINTWPGESLEVFSQLPILQRLALKSPRIERIGDVSGLQELTFLELGNARKLTSLEGLEELTNLQVLEIQRCRKISNIEPIRYLTKLKRLVFCDNGGIESLKPIAGLKELRDVYFYESTNILDGDLSPLKELPKLADTSFQDREHYNYRMADFKSE